MEQVMDLGCLLRQKDTSEKRALSLAAAACRDAGFRHVFYTPDFLSDDYLKKAEADRELLAQYGLRVEQTHAPFNRYRSYEAYDWRKLYLRTFEVSKIVGAKYVVVHADEYRTSDHYSAKEAADFAYAYLAPCADYAAKNGLVMAIESLFEDTAWPPFDGRSRFTSKLDELEGIIDRFASDSVRCCWDFGHAHLAYGDGMADALRHMGQKVVCTHTHDNYYARDLHIIPTMGEIDWQENMRALRECGYRDKLCFEFGHALLPDILLTPFAQGTHAVGEYLIGLFDEK